MLAGMAQLAESRARRSCRKVRVNCAIYTRHPVKTHQTSVTRPRLGKTLNIKRVGRWFDDRRLNLFIHRTGVAGKMTRSEAARARRQTAVGDRG